MTIQAKREYVSLPRRYRPKTFDDLVGQKAAARVLIASLTKQRIFPCYIFQGTAGSGKTSVARIFAMSLNCEQRGEDPNPCLACVPSSRP